MSCQLFWSAIWTYFLIISSTIDENQSSTSAQGYYSETNDIIAYGVSVFRTIITHGEKDGNLINILKNIKINNSKIQQLMVQNLSSILNMYSCRHENGLDSFDHTLNSFDDGYNRFENYLLHKNDQNHKFPADIVAIYKSGIFNAYIETSLHWKNVDNLTANQELFGALVDRYDLMNDNNLGAANFSKIISDFQAQVLEITDNALGALNEEPSRYILQRDPPNHKKGITHESLDYFIQGYVADQKFFRQDQMCTPTCSDHNDTVHYYHPDGQFFPQKSICTGHIRYCKNTAAQQIYLAAPDSTRRYEGLSNIPTNGESLKYWGREMEYWQFYPIGEYVRLCRICSCTCDMVDSPNSIRYVDLRLRETRYFDSFVITGIRFRIINRILYLQIQEGELRDGKILPETVAWKKIEDTDRDHDNDSQLFKLDYDNRLFDLSDLTVPSTYTIIMVGFTLIDGIVGLNIRSRPIQSGPNWILSTRSQPARPVFQPGGFDIPTIKTIKNSKVSESNKFLLKFETSDWENDAAQNVVPFIDIQDVVTDPPAPIAGIGIHVRHGGTSGGFLAPKIISFNDGLKIIPEDIKGTIASLAPDIEIAARSRAIIMEKVTPVPVVILSTSQRPLHRIVIMRRDPPRHFIAVHR